MNKELSDHLTTWFNAALASVNDSIDIELKRHGFKRSDGQLTTEIQKGTIKGTFAVTFNFVKDDNTTRLLFVDFMETGFNMYGHKPNIQVITAAPAQGFKLFMK